MIFKLLNFTIMGIALFYLAEGTGVIEKYRYFPTLPRLEASASDPMAWLGAAEWGFTQLGAMANGQGGNFPTNAQEAAYSYGNENGEEENTVSASGFRLSDVAEALANGRENTRSRLMSAYYR